LSWEHLDRAILPSYFARSETLIGSSLGGFNLGGSFGVNFLVPSTGWLSAIIAGLKNGDIGALESAIGGLDIARTAWRLASVISRRS